MNPSRPSRPPLVLWMLAGAAVLVCTFLITYRPDRPIPRIVPGSSAGPAFAVQVIRPRLGLPLGGILPPRFFGLESHLGFDSASPTATFENVSTRSLELAADGWRLVLVLDAQGRVTSGTEVTFELLFEERLRQVRCRPASPAIGLFSTTVLENGGELSGSFDIELAHCEDASTGKPLGWPPEAFVLRGSFDRLPLNSSGAGAPGVKEGR